MSAYEDPDYVLSCRLQLQQFPLHLQSQCLPVSPMSKTLLIASNYMCPTRE